MMSNFSINVESVKNFQQNQDADEKNSERNDSDAAYFDYVELLSKHSQIGMPPIIRIEVQLRLHYSRINLH